MLRNALIINADDFGLNHSVNMAIVQAFEQGYCSSCTILPNMPGFEEACELVHTHQLADHVGLHMVLTEGYPVTQALQSQRRFCTEDGRFQLTRRQRIVWLTTKEREALRAEIKGQIAKCRSHGISMTHLDSHNHVHEEWAITGVAIEVAREERIPYVRLTKSFGCRIPSARQAYRSIVNLRLRRAGLAGTDFFGLPADYMQYLKRFGTSGKSIASWELMVHPAFSDQGTLADSWLRAPLDQLIRSIPGYCAAVSYTGHRYSPEKQQVIR